MPLIKQESTSYYDGKFAVGAIPFLEHCKLEGTYIFEPNLGLSNPNFFPRLSFVVLLLIFIFVLYIVLRCCHVPPALPFLIRTNSYSFIALPALHSSRASHPAGCSL